MIFNLESNHEQVNALSYSRWVAHFPSKWRPRPMWLTNSKIRISTNGF